MGTMLKREMGAVAILVGAGLLVAGLGQRWLFPGKPVLLGPLLGALVTGSVLLTYGRRWLLNMISLDVFAADADDAEIRDAKQRAQGTLGQLWHHLERKQHECYVKFPLEVKSGSMEHIWALVHSREPQGVLVSLANQPVEEPSRATRRFVVDAAQIEDWQVVVSESEIRGGYSVAALARLARRQGYSISRTDRKRLAAFVDSDPLRELA
jgi:hypothetical protein